MSAIAPASEASRPETARRIFFKADHLRTVDRYIDYFAERPLAVVTLRPIPAAKLLDDVAPVLVDAVGRPRVRTGTVR
jgi:hypothetical protein